MSFLIWSRKLMLAPCAGGCRDRDATRTRSIANRVQPSDSRGRFLASKSRADLASALRRTRGRCKREWRRIYCPETAGLGALAGLAAAVFLFAAFLAAASLAAAALAAAALLVSC